MIQFKDWQIWADPRLELQQNDHLCHRFTVAGALPDGWDWSMLVQVEDRMDIWPLQLYEHGAATLLTAQQLGPGGFYRMQLRGMRGESVRHSNVITLFIPRSLCGDRQWPTLPTEFSDAERRILAVRDEAKSYVNHPPIILNGTWWLWDGTQYADSGHSAGGSACELTAEDKAKLVAAVVAALPVYSGEVNAV